MDTQVIALYGYHGWLKSWLLRHLNCTETAADLAQDTFIRVLLRQRRHVEVITEPKAYLTCVARRLVINHWRRSDIEQACLQALAALPPQDIPTPEAQASMVETLFAVDSALQQLPAVVRQAFLWARVDNLTYCDIATRLGCAEVTVKRYVQRGLAACLLALDDA